jgi:hypothetical protein
MEPKYHNQLLNHKTLLEQIYKSAGIKAVYLLLELGEDPDIAEQILFAVNDVGFEKTLEILLDLDKSSGLQVKTHGDETLLEAIEKIESIIGKEALIEIAGFYKYVSASLSSKPFSAYANKLIQVLGRLVSQLEEWLDFSSIHENIDVDNQVTIILTQLEHWVDFVASGITYVGLHPRYPSFDPDGDYGGSGGSSSGSGNWRGDNDGQNDYQVVLLTGQNMTNTTITHES